MTDRDLWASMTLTNLPSGTQHRQACIRYLHATRPDITLRMPREPPQCASMKWADGRKREVKQIEYYEEKWIGGSTVERRKLVSGFFATWGLGEVPG